MSAEITRRKFIKTAAVTTGAGALGGATLAAQMTSTVAQDAPTRQADVAIVGGGFAGLMAAFRLSQAGRSVVLIEATQRLGGRTFTAHLTDGTPFEIGGAWVSGTSTQSNIEHLMRELRIRKFRQFVEGNSLFEVSTGDVRVWLKDDLPPISPEALLNLGQALTKIGLMTEEINLEGLRKHHLEPDVSTQRLGFGERVEPNVLGIVVLNHPLKGFPGKREPAKHKVLDHHLSS